jgi:hypothetical protein
MTSMPEQNRYTRTLVRFPAGYRSGSGHAFPANAAAAALRPRTINSRNMRPSGYHLTTVSAIIDRDLGTETR